MTTLLGFPESAGAVNALAQEVNRANHRIKFGVKSMASFGIYPLVKAVQAALHARSRNASIGDAVQAALFR